LFSLLRFTTLSFLLLMLTLCLACGLYYLAELIEEHIKTTKKVLKYAIWVSMVFHFLMMYEGLPISYLLLGIVSNVLYLMLLPHFPKVKLTNLIFIVSFVIFFVSHYLWFNHFSSLFFPFSDIISFFTICVWLVPFIFFVSLTSDDNQLPYNSFSATGEAINGEISKKHGNKVVLFFDNLFQNKDKYIPNWLRKFFGTKYIVFSNFRFESVTRGGTLNKIWPLSSSFYEIFLKAISLTYSFTNVSGHIGWMKVIKKGSCYERWWSFSWWILFRRLGLLDYLRIGDDACFFALQKKRWWNIAILLLNEIFG